MNRKFYSVVAVMLIVSILLITWISVAPDIGASSTSGSYSSSHESAYTKRFFNINKVIDIYITLSETDLKDMVDNATKEEYKQADIVIDGETVKNVGIRAKGNSSLNSVANSDSDRFSFKIDFNQYNEGQSLLGLTKLNLNNCMSDASYMREYLSYYLFDQMGVPTPAYCFTNIYINGKLHGLYTAVEGPEESFVERYYGEDYGTLYKPYGERGAGTDFVYKDDNIESYNGLQAVTKLKNDSNESLIAMIKALNESRDLEKYLDVDEILRYFAVNTVIASMDSYQGQFTHNYYLYGEDGVFSMLPWDFNMSFGGFGMGGGSSGSTSLYIDQPVSGTTLEARPMLGKLLAVPEYKEKYHKYIQQFINGPFTFEKMKSMVKETADLIRLYVEKDPTKFVTMDQFEQAVSEVVSSTQQNTANSTTNTTQGSSVQNQNENGAKTVVPNGTTTVPDGNSQNGTGSSDNSIIQAPDGSAAQENTAGFPQNGMMPPDGAAFPDGNMMPRDGMMTPPDGNIPSFNGNMSPPDGMMSAPVTNNSATGGSEPVSNGNTMMAGGLTASANENIKPADGTIASNAKNNTAVEENSSSSGTAASSNSNTQSASNNVQTRNGGMGKMGGGMMTGGNSSPLLTFISARIENVTKQLNGELPATGTTTQTQSGWQQGEQQGFGNGMRQGQRNRTQQDSGNNNTQQNAGNIQRPNMQNGVQQNSPNGLQQSENSNMQQDGRSAWMQQGQDSASLESKNTTVQGSIQNINTAEQKYIIAGSALLLLLAIFVIFKKRTKYSI